MPFSPSSQFTENTGILQCSECGKWRAMYIQQEQAEKPQIVEHVSKMLYTMTKSTRLCMKMSMQGQTQLAQLTLKSRTTVQETIRSVKYTAELKTVSK